MPLLIGILRRSRVLFIPSEEEEREEKRGGALTVPYFFSLN